MKMESNASSPQLPDESEAVTVTDVARLAKVSVSTVSRILNGTARVSADKRSAVEAAIRTLSFKPNQFARGLKMGTTMTVGVVTQDIESPFFTRVMKGVEEALSKAGYALFIVSGHWDAHEEEDRIRLLAARRVDGIVIITGRLEEHALRALAQRQPIVVAGRDMEAHNVRSVCYDQEYGGFLATRYLISMGHRRIAFITGVKDHPDAQRRYAGYCRALQEAGLHSEDVLVQQGDFTESGGVLAMTRLLDSQEHFTAVFAANDQTALGARMVLHRRGIRVPDDISLVGFDDLPAAAFQTPPLTTVRQPLFEMGAYCGETLLRMLGNNVPERELPGLELVVRDTVRRI
ncbi:LacI family DNA-binding transcriptional regulator [Viridibacterium curvum]|uniref:LacI family DNA-binding transcriptional regulator n=1 Tax=Viridibacterium curvum TaxID=1101404 RepID=A0ABP9R3U2_9RHOO